MIFEIGAIPIALVSNNAVIIYHGINSYSNFISDTQPDVELYVSCQGMPVNISGQLIFETQLGWSFYKSEDDFVIWVRSPDYDPYQLGVFSSDFRSGEIYVRESDTSPGFFNFPLNYPMGQVFMTNLLSKGYGVILHACAVIDHGKGIVFAGIGRAGKTTTARLWNGLPGVRVLNDDRVLVRKLDGKFMVYGTPWHGEGKMALPDSAPLEQIFILQHYSENRVAELSPVDAASRLLVRSQAPHWDAQGMDFTLNMLAGMCLEIPCYEYGFVPDQSAVDFIRCL